MEKDIIGDKLSFTAGEQLMTHTSVGGTWDGVGYIADFMVLTAYLSPVMSH
jgi:hypothetical protein